MTAFEPRLTSLAHGGGCGCKLSPATLREILAAMPAAQAFPDLLVGIETSDDAAVYWLNDEQAVVATTDFFTPIVDNPYDFGRIAATNALSDIYAMGGQPIFALAILGMPVGKVSIETISAIMSGGARVCGDAGIPIAGGHSIDSLEPIYGLAAIGLVRPDRVLRNAGARPADVLVLSKALGIGVISAALKSATLDSAVEQSLYTALIHSTTQLNKVGPDLANVSHVHAMTDVTGFGLLGHTLEICRASSVGACLNYNTIPLLDGVTRLSQIPHRTGAALRNWNSYGNDVVAESIPEWMRDLLCDPQTSGGLLIAVAPEGVKQVIELLNESGFDRATAIGHLQSGTPTIRLKEI